MGRRVLIVTTNLAESSRARAAAGNTWRLVFEELGRSMEGTILAPRALGEAAEGRLGGFRVRRVGPVRPVESLDDALLSRNAWRIPAMVASLWSAVREELRTEWYDVIHAFWAFPAGVVSTHPRPDVPVLVSCPGSDLHKWGSRAGARWLIASTLRRASAVTAHSADALESAHALGARAVHSLPVCFDTGAFEVNNDVPREPVIAYAGRLSRSKGVFDLADAIDRLAPRLPGLSLEVCGIGPDADAFGRRIDASLGGRAQLHGALDPPSVASLLARSRLVVLPSHGEGMSATAIEALASGRAVVTTDTGEHAGIVRRGGGRVVPIGDPAALARAIDEELRTHRDPAALRGLVSHLTPSFVAQRLTEIYGSVVEGAYSARESFEVAIAGGQA